MKEFNVPSHVAYEIFTGDKGAIRRFLDELTDFNGKLISRITLDRKKIDAILIHAILYFHWCAKVHKTTARKFKINLVNSYVIDFYKRYESEEKILDRFEYIKIKVPQRSDRKVRAFREKQYIQNDLFSENERRASVSEPESKLFNSILDKLNSLEEHLNSDHQEFKQQIEARLSKIEAKQLSLTKMIGLIINHSKTGITAIEKVNQKVDTVTNELLSLRETVRIEKDKKLPANFKSYPFGRKIG